MKKGKWIGIELPTATGFTNVLIGLNIDGSNSIEYCNEADIELWKKGEIECPWSSEGTMRIVPQSKGVFDDNHRIIPETVVLTIKKHRFIAWYFEYGQDKENNNLKLDLAESIIHQLLSTGSGSISARELFNNCNHDSIRAFYTEEYDGLTDEYGVELSDLPFKYEIKLIN